MNTLVSLEFENDRIKIIEGIKKGKILSVSKCISIELPHNCIDDGKIVNTDIVKKWIEKALKDNSIKTRKAAFIINSNLVISRKIDLPYLRSKKDIKSMIHYSLEEMFSTNVNQYLFIYIVSDVFISKGVKYANYIIHGLPIRIYNHYIELSRSLKFELKKLDISSSCLENLAVNELSINYKQYISENTNAFININRNSFSFSVLNHGINEFCRNYYVNEHEVSVGRVAEDFEGYSGSNLYNYTAKKDNSNGTTSYTDEILKYIKYYYSINKSKVNIEKIYVYGDGCYAGIDNELSSSLDTDVELIQDISNITVENSYAQNKIDIKEYLGCVLALFKSKSSNFLTESQKYHRIRFVAGVAIMSVLSILVLFLSMKIITYLYKDIIMENEMEAMMLFIEDKDNINQNVTIEKRKQQIDEINKYLEHATEAIDKINSEDYIDSDLINEIIASVPEGTSIYSIFIDNSNIQLMCRSSDIAQISIILTRLRNIKFINNIHIPEIEINDTEDIKSYSYQILCNTKGIK